jgi:hypothetical protein
MALNEAQARKLLELGAISQQTYDLSSGRSPAALAPMIEEIPVPVVEKVVAKPEERSTKDKLLNLLKGGIARNSEKISDFKDIAKGGLAAPQAAPQAMPQNKAQLPLEEPAPTPMQEEVMADELVADQIEAPTAQQMTASQAQGRLSNMEKGYDIQQEAVMKGAQAGMQQASAEAAYLEQTRKENEDRLLADQMAEDARQKMLDAQLVKLTDATQRFNQTPATVGERFANASTGSKIMLGISMFLGSAGEGGNSAIAAMQKAVDGDIAKAKQDTDNQKLLYNEMLDTFKDTRQAEAATRIAYIENAQLKLQQIASQYKSPQIAANAEKLFGEMEVAKQNQMLEFTQSSVNNPTLQQADELTRNIMRLPKELQNKALEEKGIIEGLNLANDTIGGAFDTVSKIGGIAGNIPFTKSKANVDAAGSQIMSVLVANWKGPMSDTDMKRVQGLMPSVTDTSGQTSVKKQKLLDLMAANAKPTPILKGFNLTPSEKKRPNLKAND